MPPFARDLVVNQDLLELLAPGGQPDEVARLPVTERERRSLEDDCVQVEPAGAIIRGQRLEERCLDSGFTIVSVPRNNDRNG